MGQFIVPNTFEVVHLLPISQLTLHLFTCARIPDTKMTKTPDEIWAQAPPQPWKPRWVSFSIGHVVSGCMARAQHPP